MLTDNSKHTERFKELLGEVKQEIDALKKQLGDKQKKNKQLKSELKKMKEDEADVFSSVKETERMSLKHQIKGLVSKIDEHLEQ